MTDTRVPDTEVLPVDPTGNLVVVELITTTEVRGAGGTPIEYYLGNSHLCSGRVVAQGPGLVVGVLDRPSWPQGHCLVYGPMPCRVGDTVVVDCRAWPMESLRPYHGYFLTFRGKEYYMTTADAVVAVDRAGPF